MKERTTMNKHVLGLSLTAMITLLASCLFGQIKSEAPMPDPLVSHIDSTVHPGDDFFLYANGKWLKENPIPASEQSYGIFLLIQDTINAQVRSICESSAALTNAEKGSNKQKIGDFFFTGMDSISLNKKGIADLKPDFDRIDGIKNMNEIIKEAAYIHTAGGSPLLRVDVGQDDKISSKNAIFISQGGLSLPDRNYYIDNDGRAVMIRQKFVQHLNAMFKILGYDDTRAKDAADNLMKLETAIAKKIGRASCRERV